MTKAAEVGAVGVKGAGASGPGSGAPPAQGGSLLNDLAFLRVLQMARSMSLTLVSDIKMYDFRGPESATSHTEASPSLLGGTGFGASGDSGRQSHAHPGNPLTAMLESAVEEIFIPYMEGSKYVERESKNLTELYTAYLAKFTTFHRTSAKVKTSTIFDRVRAAAGGSTSPAPAAASSSGSTSAQGSSSAQLPLPAKTSAFSKLSGFVDRARGASNTHQQQQTTAGLVEGDSMDHPSEAVTPVTASHDDASDSDGELTLTVAERMLRWHAEAIGRCVDLSSPSDVAKNAFALLKVLAEALLKAYLETAIDAFTAQLASQDVRSPQMPDLSLLRVLRQVEHITSLWQHYINVALIPLTSSSVTLRREMTIFNNHNLLRVEGKCDALVQRIVDNFLSYLGNRLATQKKNDFAPKNDELAFSRMNTDPCIACSEALERAVKVIRSSLSGANAESVLLEVGVSFHSMLLDHFKKYTVSAAGGLMLTKDLAMYQDSVATFGIPALNDRFEMLRSLGNLFIVQPSVLKGYMREGSLGKIDEKLLHAFLLRRSDYAKEVRDLGGFNGTSIGPTRTSVAGDDERPDSSSSLPLGGGNSSARDQTSHSADGFRSGGSRAGRLSMMLTDLERYAAGGGSQNEPPVPSQQ